MLAGQNRMCQGVSRPAGTPLMNPDQHTLPKVGFGNLIALSLQKEARQLGCSVFVDDDLEPYAPPRSLLSWPSVSMWSARSGQNRASIA
jgi:hypothetical protein